MQSVAGRTSPATWRNNANVVPCLQSQHGGRFTDDREARAVHDEVETAARANSTTRSEIQRLPAADERYSHSSVGQGLFTGSKRHSLTAPKPP
jgi:hypothetical protein